MYDIIPRLSLPANNERLLKERRTPKGLFPRVLLLLLLRRPIVKFNVSIHHSEKQQQLLRSIRFCRCVVWQQQQQCTLSGPLLLLSTLGPIHSFVQTLFIIIFLFSEPPHSQQQKKQEELVEGWLVLLSLAM